MYKRTAAPAQTKEEMYITDAAGHTLVVADISRSSPAYEYFIFGTERIARITEAGGATPAQLYTDEATFFLYDHLGNTRVSYAVSSTTVPEIVYAGDYYPYGKVLREFDNGDGDRYLTTAHERDKETGLDYRGARYYDSDVGRFLSLDPLAKEFASWSAYNYVLGNPVMLIDADGKKPTDWFVNKKTGTVIYIKGSETVTQEALDKLGSTFAPADYERLGADDMFGCEVKYGSNGNIIEKDVFAFVNYSENFMETEGYVKAERIKVEEREFVSGGPKSNGEDVTTYYYTVKQFGESTITYTKPEDLNKVENAISEKSSGPYSSIERVKYDSTKRYGAKELPNSYYSPVEKGNKITVGLEISRQ